MLALCVSKRYLIMRFGMVKSKVEATYNKRSKARLPRVRFSASVECIVWSHMVLLICICWCLLDCEANRYMWLTENERVQKNKQWEVILNLVLIGFSIRFGMSMDGWADWLSCGCLCLCVDNRQFFSDLPVWTKSC